MTKLIPVLSILTLLIAACGGQQTTEAPPPATATAVAQPAGEETSAEEALPEPTPTQEELAPTAELPTAPSPAADPTPTAQPEVIVIEETAEVPDAGWGESGTKAQSACDHPYFPLRSGMTWSMRGGDGETITWEVGDVVGDMDSATAELTMTSAGLAFTYTWECSADGGLISYEFSNQGLSALGPDVEIEVVEGSGFFLPEPGKLEPGYSWETNYLTVYSMTQLDGEQEMEINGEMDTQQTSTVVLAEPVTYQGETVPGLFIQQDTQVDTSIAILGETMANSMAMGAEIELGRGLGMLRQTTFTDFGDFTMEVTDIYVP